MKYCSKCGNELLDEAVICPKCGCSAVSNQNKTIIDEDNRSAAQKALFTGHLLNIFAFIVPVIILAFLLVRSDGSTLIGNITSDAHFLGGFPYRHKITAETTENGGRGGWHFSDKIIIREAIP